MGGPLARTVADLAVMLDATIGEDPADPATHLPPGQSQPKFVDTLGAAILKEARIGILEPLFGDASDDREVIAVVRASIEEFKKEGGIAVSVPMPQLTAALDRSSVTNAEFKEDLANYLATSGNPPVRTLEEIVRGGLFHASLAENMNARLASLSKHTFLMGSAVRGRWDLHPPAIAGTRHPLRVPNSRPQPADHRSIGTLIEIADLKFARGEGHFLRQSI